jgi:hypothetical protein
MDARGWTRLQNPLPGDAEAINGPSKPLTEFRRPRGKPELLELGPKGFYIIPTDVLKSDNWQYIRDVFQTFVKCSWGV